MKADWNLLGWAMILIVVAVILLAGIVREVRVHDRYHRKCATCMQRCPVPTP